MAYNYIVTAQRATAVNASGLGSFTGEFDLNLLVVRNNRLELFIVTPEGLKPHKEVPMNGSIALAMFFRPHGETKDFLFILTKKYHVAILQYTDSGEIVTRAHGCVREKTARPAETGMIAVIDPLGSIIGLRLYDGLFKVIEFDNNFRELKAFNIRFEHLNVIDIQFLREYEEPTIAFIYQDHARCRHVQTNVVSVREREFLPGPWRHENVEGEAQMLIPVPAPQGGILLVGQESIMYQKEEYNITVAPPLLKASTILCYEQIDKDGSRYLLGDLAGHLFMLLLDLGEPVPGAGEGGKVRDIRLEPLGEVSIPECLTYLDNGVVFVGSRFGDSQLIKLNTEADPRGSYISILDAFTNLGPIVDMVVVDLERQGQGQLVTCSGAFKEGSLRIIRNGIGIQEHATVDLAGIKGLWALRYKTEAKEHNVLAIAFVGQTRFLLLVGEDVEEVELESAMASEQTFFIGNLTVAGQEHVILQVCPGNIRLFDNQGKGLISEWKPSSGRSISVASASPTCAQVVVACGKELYYLKVENGALCEVKSTVLDYEIACLDISPIGQNPEWADVCAAGFWTELSVKLFHLPTLSLMANEPLGGEIIPRSILMCKFDEMLYLLVALGDGTLFNFKMDKESGALVERKKATLGTQPITLRPFKSEATVNIFACSDRPMVIYSSNQKLVFSNVNLKTVNHICSLNSSGYPNSLAMADENNLIIGTVDEIQKLHIRTVPLGESPRRIAYQESTQTFAVASFCSEVQCNGKPLANQRPSASTICSSVTTSEAMVSKNSRSSHAATAGPMEQSAETSSSAGNMDVAMAEPEDVEVEINNLLIIDQNTFEVLHVHRFNCVGETCCSLLSCKLGDDATEYYIVGTAEVQPDHMEPKKGRLLVFQYTDGKLKQIAEKDIKGCPYTLANFNGKLLATISSSVRLYEWTAEKELRLECSHFNFIVALYAKVKGDFVLTGDLMRSMALLAYKPVESTFEEIARDYQPNWMTAVEVIDDDNFIGAENSFNIFTCQKDSAATKDEDRQHLQELGAFHVGDLVNVFRHGSLVMEHSIEKTLSISGSILFGTVHGAVGLIVQLEEKQFNFLAEMERNMAKSIQSVGRISHEEWRAFQSERKTEDVSGFIDGDLIESFLDLPRETMLSVVKGLQIDDGSGMKREATVEDIVKMVEDLTRTH